MVRPVTTLEGAGSEPGPAAVRAMERAIGRGLAWAAAGCGGAFTLWQLLGGIAPGPIGYGLSGLATAGGVAALLLIERRPRLAVWLLSGLLWSLMSVTLLYRGTIFSSALAGYIIVILTAGLLVGIRAALLATAASVGVATLMVVTGSAALPRPGSPIANPWYHLGSYAALFIASGVMVSVARRQIWSALTALARREQAIGMLARRLRASDARLNAIARSGFDLVVELDRTDRISWASPNHLQVVGRRAEDLVGRAPAEWLDSPEMHRAAAALRDPQEDAVSHPFRLRAADGSWHWFDMRVAPFRDAEGEQRLLVVSRDVTAVREAEEQLRHAQRMESVGQLAGGIAHDFNNLLTAIGLNLELIRDEVADRPETQGAVDVAMQAADRAASLTRALLAFSRRQEMRPEVLDLREVVEGLRPLLQSSLPDTVKVELSAPPDLWSCELDRGHLENALLNLAINARDAMTGQGLLTIVLENVTLDVEDPARPVELAPGDHVRISVRDTGQGMDAAVAARAFDPFFTTKEQGRGTGLGLAMVYGFARQSGGHASIHSDQGRGTTVRLHLPRSREPAARGER